MGMGEPFDNYDNVMQAFRVLSDQNGFAFGAHRITVSTSGKVDGIMRLAQEGNHAPNLAVSINAPSDEIRSRIMPHNRKENMQALKTAMKYYNEATGRDILVAYVLIPGVNTEPAYADIFLKYLDGLNARINLIPYNPQSNDRFTAPGDAEIEAFSQRLQGSGFRVLVRKSRGKSIMAACGQLGNAELRKSKLSCEGNK